MGDFSSVISTGITKHGRFQVVVSDVSNASVSGREGGSQITFHEFLYSGRADSAWALVSHAAPDTLTFAQFSREINGDDRRKLVLWQIQDIIEPYDLPADLQPSLDGCQAGSCCGG
jgi:hypothetical protein